MALTQTMPVPSTPASAIEMIKDTGAEKLLTSCLGLLARVYPQGLTARELVDELAKEDESFDLTSSLLSSKLNTIFRRLHNERGAPTQEQLTDLPMTRKMTDDKRKRLIYHFVPGEKAETPIESQESESPRNETETKSEPVNAAGESFATEAESPVKNVAKSELQGETKPSIPGKIETAHEQRVQEPVTPDTPTSPKRKLEEKPESRKKHSRSSFNPYYDALTMDAPLPQLATAPQSPAGWAQEMSEFEAPELIDLDALDACC